MSTPDYLAQARQITLDVINTEREGKDLPPIHPEEVFVVWFCKTLQNWKALTSSYALGSDYYELTHDGDQNQTYVDAYRKIYQVISHDEEEGTK